MIKLAKENIVEELDLKGAYMDELLAQAAKNEISLTWKPIWPTALTRHSLK